MTHGRTPASPMFDHTAALRFAPVAVRPTLETGEEPPAVALTRSAVGRALRAAMRKQSAAEILPRLPDPGTSIHIISDGRFHLWPLGTHALGLMAGPAELYVTTWLTSRDTAIEL